MPFGGKKKGKGFNLDCVLGNVNITVVTCCGFIFQGVVVEEDDDKTRAQYGCPVVFPAMTMDYEHDKDDHKKDCKDDDDKKHHCPKPIDVEVDVKCDNEPKFICLRLECPPAFVCCDPATAGAPAQIVGLTAADALFDPEDTILISLDDIAVIGPSRNCLVTA
ncbi:hypothetical protein [Sporomusa acidovorans]|uniref:Uncharacterized protein n=1 Tax=Sporomusa acidovorans (strain ATCC 49682 / DSM 3132 / Mol) TaxID=1123286 RepID=A0ABZ3J9F1_SPOA4|nr:hypothetical protein [Sporomusa acidovorans]OZC15130.1 hypothetical protein SPACI_50420 [Sporomusa acidovorans DSM 3132]SDF44321.1 hypothetical protein SAMN04488499_104936 [Sporomusa acidovorans]